MASNTTLLDVRYQQKPWLIAACTLSGPDGVAIIDPGPASAVDGLRLGLEQIGASVDDVRLVLLTHIHLDHAGASGTLVRENPAIRVVVHESGARHLVDPTRLLESARRIYGPALHEIWGEFIPVPSQNVVPLEGLGSIAAGGRTLAFAHTPGHARHHVCYLDPTTGIAFVGDTGGVRIANGPLVIPTAPPPDIDLSLWYTSLARIKEWRPDRLFLTHFGIADIVDGHLSTLEITLDEWGSRVRASLEQDGTDEDRAHRFAAAVRTDLRRALSDQAVDRYEWAADLVDSWYGVARYWRKTIERGV